MAEIHTERLTLRAMTRDDRDAVYAYSKNPNVGSNAGWKYHESPEETLDIMEGIFLDKPTVWAIVLKRTNTLIGSIGLIDDPKRENCRTRMLGYALDEGYWGKGIMTEAAKAVIHYGFKALGLTLISACCYPFNLGSKKVLAHCGFVYEGCLKEAEELYDGRVLDHLCYAIYRDSTID